MKVAMNNTVFSNNGFPPINYDLSEGEKNLSPKFDWAEALKGQVIIDDWGKLPIRNTSTPVLCKDGTTKNQPSSPTAKYEDACRDNGGRAENLAPNVGKYKVTTIDEKTTVWKSNPNATGDYNSKIAVRTLPKGTVVNVISEGTTMTSWSTTPILNIGNGEWINKSSTNVNSTEQQNYNYQNEQTPRTFYEMNKGYIFIGLALVAGYFAYKKFKK